MCGLLLPILLSYAAVSAKGAVATAHPAASEAGAAVLRQGGNAVDAAVAAAFVLSVVEPQSSGIGGGGFALVYLARTGSTRALDFREVAPAAVRAGSFLRDGRADRSLSRDGGLAVAVPGALKGYAELARRFGTRPLSRLVEPAARIAERGFRVDPKLAAAAAEALERLRADGAAAGEFLVAGKGGARVPPLPGATLVRADLARTLRALGRDPDSLYRGALAARVVAAVRARGGVLAGGDLAAYRVRDRQPLQGRYRAWRVVTVPPPSAGGAILLGLLAALQDDDPMPAGFRSEPFLHAYAEVSKRLFARRSALGDPDFAPGALAAAREMAAPGFAAALRGKVGERATPALQVAPLPGAPPAREGHTTHLSVVDAEGNAVALTTTVNQLFGACLVVPGTGMVLNDQMDDFDLAPGSPDGFGLLSGDANAVVPGKVPLSSMAPTLVFDAQDRLVLAIGSPGGPLIPGTVAQVIMYHLGSGIPLELALGVPRVHHQWLPDVLEPDPWGLDGPTRQALEARGHAVRSRGRWRIANPQAVRVDPASGLREAAGDPRLEGVPAAP